MVPHTKSFSSVVLAPEISALYLPTLIKSPSTLQKDVAPSVRIAGVYGGDDGDDGGDSD